MSNFINIASRSLVTIQQMITTTGHNISNASNEHYHRQTTHISTENPQRIGIGYLGNGVKLDHIDRVFDQQAVNNLRSASSSLSEQSTIYDFATSLDSLLSQQSSSISSSIEDFYASLEQVIAQPDSMPVRQDMITKSQNLINRFHHFSKTVGDMKQNIAFQMQSITTQVNTTVKEIAKLNVQISTTHPSPDLLDQRDKLITQLAEKISFNVIEKQNGAIDLTVGNGQSLLLGGEHAIEMLTQHDPIDSGVTRVAMLVNQQPIDVTNTLSGGEIGGLIRVQDDLIGELEDQMGYLALSLSDAFNEQNQLGMDLQNQLGRDFFHDINSAHHQLNRISDHPSNTGTANLTVNLQDLSHVEASKYELRVLSASNYELVRLSDQTVTSHTTFPINIDGMNVALDSGTVQTGDIFLIKPTSAASSAIDLNTQRPEDLAIASPIRTKSFSSNLGDAQMSLGQVTDASTALFTTTSGQLAPPLRVEFLSATSYQLVNDDTAAVIEGPLSYDPTQSNALFPTTGAYDPGIRASITGTPQTGDRFLIEYNTNGFNDNRNGILLGDQQESKRLNQGTNTLQSYYSSILTQIGNQTNQASTSQEAAQLSYQQAQANQQSISGVNLDEEAAKLISLQQAYQASAQMINIGNELFQTLFNSI